MKRRTLVTVFSIVVAISLCVPALRAELLSDTGDHNIEALLTQARQAFDFESEDAVILLQQERRLWTGDGRRVYEFHRIVWISTARGIRTYADLRVPWDSTHQTLTPETLRSWRPSDRRWTTSGPTAIVDTTPYELAHAVDYTNVRETMLLHDGVELPCILETRYVIEDNDAFAGGMDGIHTMAEQDPILISEFVLGAPEGAELIVESKGVGEVEQTKDEDSGLQLRTFRLTNLDALPVGLASTTEVQHVAWSTWAKYNSLDITLTDRLNAAAELDEASRNAAETATRDARSPIEKAEKLASWVAESTSFVDYDGRLFPLPRPAHRTWSTAYGHSLDRAVLAAAAFREAGFGAGLAYKRPVGASYEETVATLSLFEGPLLWVVGEGFSGIYDPNTSELAVGSLSLSTGDVWQLGAIPMIRSESASNSAEVRFDIIWNGDDATWEGLGALRAGGTLSPFSHMQGLEADRSRKVLESLAGSVISAATVAGFNFERFVPEAIHAGFTVSAKAGERDSQNRMRLEIGDPATSLNDPFHAASPLYESERDSAVYILAPVEVSVTVHLDHKDLEVVALPVPLEVKNDIGTFKLETEQSEDGVTLRRSLRINKAEVTPDEWPQLRALLLANSSPKNRILLFR